MDTVAPENKNLRDRNIPPGKSAVMIIIVVFVVVLIGAMVYMIALSKPQTGTVSDLPIPIQSPIVTVEQEKPTWNLLREDRLGFSVEYPRDWRYRYGSKEDWNSRGYEWVGFCSGICQDSIWGITKYDKQRWAIEEIIADNGEQFGNNRSETRENIFIDGATALKVVVTTSEVPDWQHEQIIFDSGDSNEYIFVLSNGAVKDPGFDRFYNSFKFIEFSSFPSYY